MGGGGEGAWTRLQTSHSLLSHTQLQQNDCSPHATGTEENYRSLGTKEREGLSAQFVEHWQHGFLTSAARSVDRSVDKALAHGLWVLTSSVPPQMLGSAGVMTSGHPTTQQIESPGQAGWREPPGSGNSGFAERSCLKI